MRFIICLLIALLFSGSSAFAGLYGETSIISPQFLTAFETDTPFKNPCELTLYDKVLTTSFRYGLNDQRFSGLAIVKIPDFGFGDLGYSIDAFGTNFGQNLIWVDTGPWEGYFTLAKGGYKQLFTWAKKTRFLTVGLNLKHYYYRELNNGVQENGLGWDAGMLLTPFPDLLVGIFQNDIGDTTIYDTVTSTPTRSVKARTWVTFTALSGKDMVLTLGVPTDIMTGDPKIKGLWKRTAFSVKKIFSDTLIADAGYNTKDAYLSVGTRVGEYLTFHYTISNDLSVKDGTYAHLVSVSFVVRQTSWEEIFEEGLFEEGLLGL